MLLFQDARRPPGALDDPAVIGDAAVIGVPDGGRWSVKAVANCKCPSSMTVVDPLPHSVARKLMTRR